MEEEIFPDISQENDFDLLPEQTPLPLTSTPSPTLSNYTILNELTNGTFQGKNETIYTTTAFSLYGLPLILTFSIIAFCAGFVNVVLFSKLHQRCIPPTPKTTTRMYKNNDIEMDSFRNGTYPRVMHDDDILTEIDILLSQPLTSKSRMSSESMLHLMQSKESYQKHTFTTFRPLSMDSLSESEDFTTTHF